MIKFFCDRCGKEVPSSAGVFYLDNIRIQISDYRDTDKIICIDCGLKALLGIKEELAAQKPKGEV